MAMSISKNLLLALVIVVAGAGRAWCTSFAPLVKTGLDVLIMSNYSILDENRESTTQTPTILAGKKVLMLTNPTGVTPQLDLGLDVMHASGQVNVVGVMGPEHGFRGTEQNGGGSASFIDAKTGLTVYDAYNVNATVLRSYIDAAGADTLIFDIQDVGARFYTYVWAMYDAMVAAALSNITFVVLDRPNPIGGLDAFGPVLNESLFNSYVGRRAISQVHGMTVGDLARMFVGEGWIRESAGLDRLEPSLLQVVKMRGWDRSMTFRDTGLPWVLPSPNMPTLDTAMIYPGTCMFEGTTISEGRGTTRPFEIIGAPWTNESWTTTMRSLGIPGTGYRFQCFTPTTSKFANQVACGLQTYVVLENGLDSQAGLASFDAPFVGLNLLWSAYHLYSDNFTWTSSAGTYTIDLLTGSTLIREGIGAGLSPNEIRRQWQEGLEAFRSKRGQYLLY